MNAPDIQPIIEWINSAEHVWALKMRANLLQYGSLTPRQIEASARIMEQATNPAAAPQSAAIDLAAIESAFERAKRVIAKPKMTLKHFTFKCAPASGRNPGAIYITDVDSTYLGKVFNGQMTLSRDCTPAQLEEIRAIAADPKAAAIAHGKQWGVCCICNRTLTDPDSVANGIGPICQERFGW